MFINLSNHPSSQWDQGQLNEARKLGRVIDMPFPNVSPKLNEKSLDEMADRTVKGILEKIPGSGTVMVQGEFSLGCS